MAYLCVNIVEKLRQYETSLLILLIHTQGKQKFKIV